MICASDPSWRTPATPCATTPLDVTFTARAGPVSIVDPSLEVTDPDQTMIYQATITLLNPTDGSFEKVQVDTSGTKITAGAYQAKSGILELSGLDTLANYQNVLRTATYDNVGEMIDQAVRTITITVGDGVVFSNRLTTRVTMKPASPSAPQTDDEEEIVEGENTFVANGDPLRVAKRLTVRDPDSTLLQSATVTLVDPPDADEEVLAVDTTGTAITALYDPESAVLVLVGADTPSHYQQVLNTLTYDNLALLPDARPRQVEIVVSDGTYEGLVTSITFTITTVNHAPILQPGSTFTLDDFDEIAPRESVVGTWVGDLLESGVPGDAITDIDPNDEGGIAVVYTAATNARGYRLTDQIKALRRQIATDLGFVMPSVRILDNMQLGANEYRISVKEVEAGRGELMPGSLLVMDPRGEPITLPGMPTKEPAFGLPAAWIDEEYREEASFRGFTIVDPATVLTTHLTEILKEHMPELLSYAETKKLIDDLPADTKKLADELIPQQVSMATVQRVLQILLAERVSIRDLPLILEALGEGLGATQSILLLVEHVRSRLARQICAACTGEAGVIPVVTLSPAWEQAFAAAIVGQGDDRQLAMAPSELQRFMQALRDCLEQQAMQGELPVVVASGPIRPFVRAVVERCRPSTVVLSQNEIHPKARVRALGQV